jgi:hypothetical protein
VDTARDARRAPPGDQDAAAPEDAVDEEVDEDPEEPDEGPDSVFAAVSDLAEPVSAGLDDPDEARLSVL